MPQSRPARPCPRSLLPLRQLAAQPCRRRRGHRRIPLARRLQHPVAVALRREMYPVRCAPGRAELLFAKIGNERPLAFHPRLLQIPHLRRLGLQLRLAERRHRHKRNPRAGFLGRLQHRSHFLFPYLKPQDRPEPGFEPVRKPRRLAQIVRSHRYHHRIRLRCPDLLSPGACPIPRARRQKAAAANRFVLHFPPCRIPILLRKCRIALRKRIARSQELSFSRFCRIHSFALPEILAPCGQHPAILRFSRSTASRAPAQATAQFPRSGELILSIGCPDSIALA